MRILAFSDLHCDSAAAARLVERASGADLVLGVGDFAVMRRGLSKALAPFAALAPPLALTPGNAESEAELRDAAAALLPAATVLHGQSGRCAGAALFGLGYAAPVTPFGDWSCDLTEEAAERLLAALTTEPILMSHSPPHGVADRTSRGARIGSTAVRAAIERAQPRLAVCGHVHDCWGETGSIGETRIVNAGPGGVWIDLPDEGPPHIAAA